MDITTQYFIVDVLQTGVIIFFTTYFLGTLPVYTEGQQAPPILEVTEEMLWTIAWIFGIGIILGLFFIAFYFVLYMLRDCLGKRNANHYREVYATSATQLFALYPGVDLAINVWGLIQNVFYLGTTPIMQAVVDPDQDCLEEVCVFYCVTLVAFWTCLSIAIFLLVVASYKILSNVSRLLGITG